MSLTSLFKRDPRKRLEREIRDKTRRAMQLQRNGKLLEFAELTAELEALERQLASLDPSAQG